MTALPMQRAFVEAGGRRAHLRRWGDGPAVVLVHGSPQSSRAVETQASVMAAAGLCAIAPDTPGNGLSDALAKPDPDSGDYARALAELLDVLGLGRVGLYGFHTGAATATAFAALYPDRTTAVVVDGLPAWTEAERSELLGGYLPPFRPHWDGSHLTWMWARLEEQTVFFPWHTPEPAARMDYDVSSPEHIHANAMDLLDAGDAYRPAYRAAFTFRPEAWLERVAAPMLIAATALDPLRPHLARPTLAARPSQVFDSGPELHRAAAAFLRAAPGDPAPAAFPRLSRTAGFALTGSGPLAWRGRLDGAGRLRVWLHAAGRSARAPADAEGPALAFDLPGHGESRDLPLGDVQATVALIGEAARAMGLDQAEVSGAGLGRRLAEALDGRADDEDAAAGARALLAHGVPSLAPEWDGAHLLRAFRIARWERLFEPWFARDRLHAKPQGDLAPDAVHARAVELLKATGWRRALELEAQG